MLLYVAVVGAVVAVAGQVLGITIDIVLASTMMILSL